MTKLHFTLRSWTVGLAMVALLPLSAGAQVSQDWVATNAGAYGDMLALDRSNNAYVVGSIPWSTILVAKYGPGGALLWQRNFDNPGTREQGAWITTDSGGNAVVAGTLVGGDGNDPIGIVVLKYDPAGNLLWQDVIPAAFTYSQRVVTDDAGNVYLLGRSWGTNASGSTTLDLVTIKYSAGGVRQWTRYHGLNNTSADAPAAMVVTPTGNVIVTGGTSGSMLLAAYSPAGTTLWTKAIPATTAAMDIAIGPGGEFYVVGGTYSATNGYAVLVVKHDAAFNEVWRKTYKTGQYGLRVAVDRQGNAVLTGIASPNGGYLNWVTQKLDPAGTSLWVRTYDQHRYNDEVPYGIAIGADDAIYVTGQGGPGPLSGSVSYLRTVTVKYTASGNQEWAQTTFDGVRGLGVKLGSDNGVFVVTDSPLNLFHYRQDGALNQPPLALASANVTSGPAPLSVSFNSAGSADPDGSIAQYRWDFGDGSSALSANAVHSYAAGTYNATLTVTDNLGAATTSAPIAITANPVAPPPATPTALSLGSYTITGGRSTQGLVTVSSTAGVVVQLVSSNPSLVRVPSSVQVRAGSTSASFKVSTQRVRTSTPVTLTATANGRSISTTLTLVR